ncbi:hypothetical protein G6F57_018496 [Rhizopus arrhizus]|nr:hypothetical protein G6F57_018496 [Rhizopus arrhizus]
MPRFSRAVRRLHHRNNDTPRLLALRAATGPCVRSNESPGGSRRHAAPARRSATRLSIGRNSREVELDGADKKTAPRGAVLRSISLPAYSACGSDWGAASAQAALVVGLDDLDADLLADLQHIDDVRDAVVGDFRDVQQTITARQHLHDGAEVQQTQDRAFVDLAHFDVGGQFDDAALGFFGLRFVDAGDHDRAVVGDVDLRAAAMLAARDVGC